jgi:hypothetical protein
MDTQHNHNQNFLNQLEDFFNTYLHKKVPFQLPPKVKEAIVKYGPWIILVLMVLAIPAILLALGLNAAIAPYAMYYGGYHYSSLFMLSGLISLLALILEAVALPGLFSRSLKGWHMLYYSTLVSFVGQILMGNLIGGIIGLAISIYILFQVREYYK